MEEEKQVIQIDVDFNALLDSDKEKNPINQEIKVIPLILTTQTKEIFKCDPETDLSEECPFLWIKKEAILEDIFERKAISDFHPFRDFIQEYPEEELLLVYDEEMKYGEPFYLCIDQAMREELLESAKSKLELDSQGNIILDFTIDYGAGYKPPVSKKWVSLGSEKEIDPSSCFNIRVLIRIQAKREKDSPRDVGVFVDRNAVDGIGSYFECPSLPPSSEILYRNLLDKAVQAVKVQDSKLSQTLKKTTKNVWTEYHPRYMTETEAQEILSDPDLAAFLDGVFPMVEEALYQNEHMDIFREDWELLAKQEHQFTAKKDEHLQAYQSFHSLHYSQKKIITCIRWHPTIEGIVAMSCAVNCTMDQRAENISELVLQTSHILIWSFVDPIHPQVVLESPDDVLTFQFNPVDSNLVAGGTITGLVALWDLSRVRDSLLHPVTHEKKPDTGVICPWTYLEEEESYEMPKLKACAVSKLESSPTGAIHTLKWIPPHMVVEANGVVTRNTVLEANQFMTTSLDGTISFWDLRPTKRKPDVIDYRKGEQPYSYLDLNWKPFHEFQLKDPNGKTLFTTVFDFELLEEPSTTQEIFESAAKAEEATKEEKKQDDAPAPKPTEDKDNEEDTSEEVPPELMLPISTKFYVGSELGHLAVGDWTFVKEEGPIGELVPAAPEFFTDLHCNRIIQIERSPYIKHIFLSIGGWKAAVWDARVKDGPFFESASSHCYLTCGHWSSQRPSVFFVGRQDGNVEVWDLFIDTHRPIQVQNLSVHPVTYIVTHCLHGNKHILAVGDTNGTLYILALPWTLWHSDPTDSEKLKQCLAREDHRIKYKAMLREEEERIKTEMAAEMGPAAKPVVSAVSAEEEVDVMGEMRLIYKDYLKIESQVLKLLKP